MQNAKSGETRGSWETIYPSEKKKLKFLNPRDHQNAAGLRIHEISEETIHVFLLLGRKEPVSDEAL
jgi:hypothetical protein